MGKLQSSLLILCKYIHTFTYCYNALVLLTLYMIHD